LTKNEYENITNFSKQEEENFDAAKLLNAARRASVTTR